ncbi:hypothetical protein Q3V45_26425 [Klebsiella pneumoniae]|uniref:hypothetical protein n=1 Tax=Klebsiella pneumoniae TaxID=573 RepID=UPI0026767A88|nr:hypothetical protein [Klebsiella pneumoniae]MDO3711175.1 hypothetical protein [Klebsiella pneumoniae]
MGSCAAPSAKGDDKFITTDYLQQCPKTSVIQWQGVKPSSKSRLPANQFPAAGLAVDFCQQYYPLDARPGREIASKKDCRYQRCGLYYLYRTIQIMEKLNR